jgi:hypothetical protein
MTLSPNRRTQEIAGVIISAIFVLYGLVTYIMDREVGDSAATVFALGSFFAFSVGIMFGRMTANDSDA